MGVRHLAGLGEDSLKRLARGVADVNFGNLPRLQRFIRRNGADAVLCGCLHMTSDDPRDPDFTAALGKVPVFCMGRSGGVHQGEGNDDVLAWRTTARARGGRREGQDGLRHRAVAAGVSLGRGRSNGPFRGARHRALAGR